MNNTTAQAAGAVRSTSEGVLQGADKALESTRSFANDAIDKAGDKVRDLKGQVDPLVDQITSRAQELASRGMEYASDAKYRAQQQISRYADVTGRYVAEQPVRSVMIAAAAGAAIAALILIAARSDTGRNRY